MGRPLAAFAIVLAAIAASANANAAAKEIAVLEMTVDGGADPQIGAQMTARLAEVIGKRPSVHVIAPDDIRALLEKEAKRQLLGCDEQGCLSEIVGMLGADLVVKGRVSKIDNGYGVSLSSVDAQKAKAIAHVSETWRGESIALLELVVPMVDKLFADAPEKLAGSIEITNAVGGSQIMIDDSVRGTAPAGQMGNVLIGARRIRVVEEDYEPFETWVIVKRGENLVIPAQQKALPSTPVYAAWWFWTGIAAAVVGGTAAVFVATRSDGSGAGNPSGVNVAVNANDAFTGGR